MDRLEEAFPRHSWNLQTQPGGYTVTGGKGGISFSWQELLRGARELEGLAAELQLVATELEQAADHLKRLRVGFSFPGPALGAVGAVTAVAAAAQYQTSDFAGMADKVRTAASRYTLMEQRARRSFELSRRPGYGADGHRALVPQVSESDLWGHLGDEITAGLLVLGIMKFGMFETGPISTTLLQPEGKDRTVENYDSSLSGLLRRTGELGTVNGEAVEGVIEVSAIAVEGQPERYVVTIPGVQTWNPYDTEQPLDLTGSIAAISGSPHMARAVSEALKEAGASAGADVMLVGHSGGGLHARAVAANPAFVAEFDPKYVVTAGSPVGNTPLPDHAIGLNVQQKWDPVPGLDVRDPPDTPNNVTVEFQTPALEEPSSDAALAGHEIYNYATKAEKLETSEHPSVAPVVAGMAAFAPKGASVSSYKFKLARRGENTDEKPAKPQDPPDYPDIRWAKGR